MKFAPKGYSVLATFKPTIIESLTSYDNKLSNSCIVASFNNNTNDNKSPSAVNATF